VCARFLIKLVLYPFQSLEFQHQIQGSLKAKAVPLHATVAVGGGGEEV
jgi:hypothetical protein